MEFRTRLHHLELTLGHSSLSAPQGRQRFRELTPGYDDRTAPHSARGCDDAEFHRPPASRHIGKHIRRRYHYSAGTGRRGMRFFLRKPNTLTNVPREARFIKREMWSGFHLHLPSGSPLVSG